MTTLAWLGIAILLAMAGGLKLFALSANASVSSREAGLGHLSVAAATHIYRNAIVGLSGGYARGLVSGDRFAGIAYDEADNSSGAAGAATVQVHTLGEFILTGSGFAITDVGKKVYASDDGTISVTGGAGSYIGVCTGYVSATQLRVLIDVQTDKRVKITTVASVTNVTITTAMLNGVVIVTGTTASNLNLPAAATAGAGAWVTFMKTGATGALTIEPDASETLNGAANNNTMDAAYDTITCLCTGTEWLITAKNVA